MDCLARIDNISVLFSFHVGKVHRLSLKLENKKKTPKNYQLIRLRNIVQFR